MRHFLIKLSFFVFFVFVSIFSQSVTWQQIDTLPEARSSFFSFTLLNKIFIIGGINSQGTVNGQSNHAELLSPISFGSWFTLEPVVDDLYQFGTGINVQTSYIYVAGGRTHDSPRTEVQYCKIQSDGLLTPWQNTIALPQGLNSQASLLINNRFYQFGGVNQFSIGTTDSVILSDINPDGSLVNWVSTSPLPIKVGGGLALYSNSNNKVYHIGGFAYDYSPLNNVYFADINADGTIGNWNQTVTLPDSIAGVAGCITDNLIFVFGGQNNTSPQDKIYKGEILPDGSISSWELFGLLPEPLAYAQLIINNNGIYILGGEGTDVSNKVYFSELNNFIPSIFEPICYIPQRDIELGESNILWAVSQQHFGIRINLANCNIIDTVYFDIPIENDGRGVAWDGTNLWYSEWALDTLYVIDPDNGNSLFKHLPPGTEPQGLAYGGGFIWHTDENSNVIYKLNPVDGTVVGTLPVPDTVGWYVGIAYNNGTLWLSNHQTNNITQIDANTGNIRFSINFPYGPTGDITCNNDYLYLVGQNTLYRLNFGITPVELQSFTSEVINTDIHLNWITATETNNNGFEIKRNDLNIGFVNGTGTSTVKNSYRFIDKNLQPGLYQYSLIQLDFNGRKNEIGRLIVELGKSLLEFELIQNYPNPFNPETKINYAIPRRELVSLKIYNILGGEVVSLINKEHEAGYYSFDFNATNLTSGVYIYRIQAGNFIQSKKMILIK